MILFGNPNLNAQRYLTSVSWLLEAIGTGAGVATLRLQVSENITATIDGSGNFYTDSDGTLGESKTWSITSGALRTIYIRVPSGSCNLVLSDRNKLIKIGTTLNGWVASTNAPKITIDFDKLLNLNHVRITGYSQLYGAPPSGVTYWYLSGNNIYWTYTGAPPSGVAYWYLIGNNINWTYTGAPPSGVAYWYLSGNTIDYINTNFSGTYNITNFTLSNWRSAKIQDAEMITILNSLASRVGSLPATATIGDYLNYASPPAEVTAAKNALIAAKGCTVAFGA